MSTTTKPVDDISPKPEQINKTIQKDVEKIVDKYDIEDVATQCNSASNKTVSYCRCWKSKKVFVESRQRNRLFLY